jgi:hypothetical protein
VIDDELMTAEPGWSNENVTFEKVKLANGNEAVIKRWSGDRGSQISKSSLRCPSERAMSDISKRSRSSKSLKDVSEQSEELKSS